MKQILLATALFASLHICNASNGIKNTPGSSKASAQGVKHAIGFVAGWGSPYGWGVEYGLSPTNQLEINAGLGFSLSGLRAGIGSRFFFINKKHSPFIGINYAHTTGVTNFYVTLGEDTNHYELPENQAVFLRAGYKFDFSRVRLMGQIGRGIPVKNKVAILTEGHESPDHQMFDDAMMLGGLEISFTAQFRFGR